MFELQSRPQAWLGVLSDVWDVYLIFSLLWKSGSWTIKVFPSQFLEYALVLQAKASLEKSK